MAGSTTASKKELVGRHKRVAFMDATGRWKNIYKNDGIHIYVRK